MYNFLINSYLFRFQVFEKSCQKEIELMV